MRVLLLLIASSFLLSSIPPKSIMSLDALAANDVRELDGKSNVKIIRGTSSGVFSQTSTNVLHVSPNKARFIRDPQNLGILRSVAQVERLKKINIKIIRPKPVGLIAYENPQHQDITIPETIVMDRAPVLNFFNIYVVERPAPVYRFQRYTGFKNQYYGQRYLGFRQDYFGPRYLEGAY